MTDALLVVPRSLLASAVLLVSRRVGFKAAAGAVLAGVKMEKAAAGECVKVRCVCVRDKAKL